MNDSCLNNNMEFVTTEKMTEWVKLTNTDKTIVMESLNNFNNFSNWAIFVFFAEINPITDLKKKLNFSILQ